MPAAARAGWMRRGWSMWDSATGGFRAWAADQGGKCRGVGVRAKEGAGTNLM
jgi:hypothetical protein